MVSKKRPMPKPPKDPELAGRLNFVLKACGYTTDAEFARAAGLKNAQNVGAWRARGSFGKSDVLVSQVTGADLLWLRTGDGEPFPNGPTLYAGAQLSGPGAAQRLADLERDVTDLVTAFAAALRQLSAKTPDAAADVAAALRAHLSRPDRPSAVLPELLVAAESGFAQAGRGAPGKKPRSAR